MREIVTLIHKGSRWGLQAMCDIALRTYECFLYPYEMLYGLPDLGN
jgi:hypothetical protein